MAVESRNVEGNARLTGLAAVVLLVLLAAEGVTVLRIGRLLSPHIFIGILLVPLVVLKLGSTGYRFVRYYTGDPDYRRAGPPSPLLRLVGPVVVLSTVVLFASGIELWLFGARFGLLWVTAHKLGFVVWFCAMTVHVLGHLERAPRLAVRDLRPASRLRGAVSRRSALGAALLLGVVLALASLPYQMPGIVTSG
ncbi:MAG: hypothetical protein J2P45_16280 [Candidatus Dormibacteraeota bacterium]|nr:hypothetical protein [Candidatus Dormibacteraeota bacterium]